MEELFCLISISFVIIAKVHSYITLHIYVTSALLVCKQSSNYGNLLGICISNLIETRILEV